jgi:hypothetical protein
MYIEQDPVPVVEGFGMYVEQDPVPVLEGFGAVGDPAVAAVGSVLRIPAGTLVNVGVWTYQQETDPARLAQGIVGGEKWVFHPARVQGDVDMKMSQDIEVVATDQPGVYQFRWKTWVGKLLATLTATDVDTGSIYTRTTGPNQMVEIPADQAVVVVEAAPGSTALPAGTAPVEPPPVTPPTTCPEGQWLAADGTCVPLVTVTPVTPAKPWYKSTGVMVAGAGAVVLAGVLIAVAVSRRRG